MPRRRQPPTGDLPRVFVGAQAVAAGALTARQLRGPSVARVLHGVYRPQWVRDSHDLRCEAVGLLVQGEYAITGRSAATLRGTELARTHDPVEILVPAGQRVTIAHGIEAHRVTRFRDSQEHWRGMPVASTERMALDLVRGQDLPNAVARLDAVCRADVVDASSFAAWLATAHGNGVVRAREAVALVDVRAESLPESVVRILLLMAGVEAEPQYVIRHRGAFVARVDLAVVEARVAIEYDGAWHALREQLEHDRRRMNLLRDAGWQVVHVTAEQLRRPGEVIDAVHRAIRAHSSISEPF